MSDTMYTATNKSSRAVTYGKVTFFPHIPCQVTEDDKETILNSTFGENFTFSLVVDAHRSVEEQ